MDEISSTGLSYVSTGIASWLSGTPAAAVIPSNTPAVSPALSPQSPPFSPQSPPLSPRSPPYSPPRSPWAERQSPPFTPRSPPFTPQPPPYSPAFSPQSPPYSPRSPPYSPPRSPWAVRHSRIDFQNKNEVEPEESVSAAPTPEHVPDSDASKSSFRFLEDDDNNDDLESDAGTVTPRGPAGARSPATESEVTETSYYSLTNLSDTNAHRRIAAAELRAQAVAIPAAVLPRRLGYPHAFNNHERLPLANPHPLIAHPLTPSGPYVAGSPPGPARIVTNRDDRSTPEAIYHDPRSPLHVEGRESPFSKAAYRGRDRMGPTGLEGGFAGMGL